MKRIDRILVVTVAFALAGCATTASNPRDPFESFNRAMFNFNDKLDKAAVKPAAEVYSSLLPSFVQTAIGNFFGNLGDVWTAVNNFLQGKGADGASDVIRVGVNTFFGIGGLLDIATEAGIPKHKEDFGQTLGKWGVKSGPYVVLPVFGSSTLRDTAALPLDLYADPWRQKDPVRWRNTGTVVRLVDQRAAVLDAVNLVEEAALDKYEFVRDAYLQRRESKIHDGETSSKNSYEDDVGPTIDEEPANKVVVKEEQKGAPGQPPAADAAK